MSEWRNLDPEEVIQEGDEMFLKGPGRWEKVTYSIGKKPFIFPTYQVRRRVSTPATDKESLAVNTPSAGEIASKLQQAEKERDELRSSLRSVKNDELRKERDEAKTSLRLSLAELALREKESDQLRAELDEANAALREIYMECGHPDPADGEGTTTQEVVDAVKAVCGDGLIAGDTGLIKELSDAQTEWEGILASEKLGGNIVKEAEARGVLIGLRFAQQALAKGDHVCPKCGASLRFIPARGLACSSCDYGH